MDKLRRDSHLDMRVPRSLHEALRTAARRSGVSTTALIETAISDLLVRHGIRPETYTHNADSEGTAEADRDR